MSKLNGSPNKGDGYFGINYGDNLEKLVLLLNSFTEMPITSSRTFPLLYRESKFLYLKEQTGLNQLSIPMSFLTAFLICHHGYHLQRQRQFKFVPK